MRLDAHLWSQQTRLSETRLCSRRASSRVLASANASHQHANLQCPPGHLFARRKTKTALRWVMYLRTLRSYYYYYYYCCCYYYYY